MIKALIREFPVTDILDDMTEEKIRKYAYTKDEVDALIAEAVAAVSYTHLTLPTNLSV